ncbi:MAG: TolC family protein [Acidobacteria bacterium]|nr:TolC family protein [Acidobacteriota bacterium]
MAIATRSGRFTREWIRRVAGLAIAAILTFSGGCIKYQARPIDPARLESRYRTRTLEDPGLQQFVHAYAAGKIPAWPPRVLDLQALTLAAAYLSPELDVARSQVAIASAALVTAGARVNPGMDTEAGYSTSPESRLLLSLLPRFTVETSGKRGRRILQARSRLEAERLALAEQAWRTHGKLRRAFYDHLFAKRTRDLLRMEEKTRAEIVDIFDKRLAVGEAGRPEYDVFRVDLIGTRAALRKAEGEAASTLVFLANACGVPAAALQGFVIDAPGLESLPPVKALPLAAIERAGLLHRSDIRRTLAEYAAAEAAVQLEVARQYPDIHLGPGYVFEEGFNRYVFPVSLSPLPVFHRNRGPIAVAEAQRQQIARQFVALQARAIGEFDHALAQYRAALGEYEEARTLVAVQQDREAAARRALAIGEGDRLSVATARLQTITSGSVRLDALVRARTALAALEDAVQQPLETGVLLPETSEVSPRTGESR